MSNEKVFHMELRTVYPLLVAKAEKKGRTRAEVDQAACWLTGYSPEELASLLKSPITYVVFSARLRPPTPSAGRSQVLYAACGWKPFQTH